MSKGGSELDLPPSYILSEPEWASLDFEVKRLQEQETRLKAENASLKKSLANQPHGGWATLVTCVTALAAGVYLGTRL